MWPVTYRIYYNGATYYRYQFPGRPHVVIKQGGINLYDCG